MLKVSETEDESKGFDGGTSSEGKKEEGRRHTFLSPKWHRLHSNHVLILQFAEGLVTSQTHHNICESLELISFLNKLDRRVGKIQKDEQKTMITRIH
jgi:hypothetical protein